MLLSAYGMTGQEMFPIHGAVSQNETAGTMDGRTDGSEPDSDASTVDLEQVSLPQRCTAHEAWADVSPHL